VSRPGLALAHLPSRRLAVPAGRVEFLTPGSARLGGDAGTVAGAGLADGLIVSARVLDASEAVVAVRAGGRRFETTWGRLTCEGRGGALFAALRDARESEDATDGSLDGVDPTWAARVLPSGEVCQGGSHARACLSGSLALTRDMQLFIDADADAFGALLTALRYGPAWLPAPGPLRDSVDLLRSFCGYPLELLVPPVGFVPLSMAVPLSLALSLALALAPPLAPPLALALSLFFPAFAYAGCLQFPRFQAQLRKASGRRNVGRSPVVCRRLAACHAMSCHACLVSPHTHAAQRARSS
jgi:hypothetical protein